MASAAWSLKATRQPHLLVRERAGRVLVEHQRAVDLGFDDQRHGQQRGIAFEQTAQPGLGLERRRAIALLGQVDSRASDLDGLAGVYHLAHDAPSHRQIQRGDIYIQARRSLDMEQGIHAVQPVDSAGGGSQQPTRLGDDIAQDLVQRLVGV